MRDADLYKDFCLLECGQQADTDGDEESLFASMTEQDYSEQEVMEWEL